ncbi:MAG: SGNH/GDSL hydrolase family protein [Mesorhizobium sp.]
MKTILCYGDSLTWGFNAETLTRHEYADRWPSVLQAALGDSARVIAEGLNGRTTAYDDNLAGEDRNGARVLPTLLGTHSPLDLVIIMLGSNDMKPWIHGNPLGAAHGMKRLVQIVRGHPYPLGAATPQVLLVSPPPVSRTNNSEYAAMFAGGDAASRQLPDAYRMVAREMDCGFFDAGSVSQTAAFDGVHLDAENTRAIGAALAPVVKKLLDF